MDGTEWCSGSSSRARRSTTASMLPDAGTFWYHSHANETVQIERGLYGALVVLGADEPVFDADRVLVLDDVKLDRHGQIAKHGAASIATAGREGDVARDQRPRASPSYEIAAGQVERWRIVNACSARYVRLSLGGRPFRIIGGDGGLRDDAGHRRPRRCSRPAIASSSRSVRSRTKAPRSRSSRCPIAARR